MNSLKNFAKRSLKHLGLYVSREPFRGYHYYIKMVAANILQTSSGVLHIGASRGQEANFYNSLGKPVIWVEAIPNVYEDLLNKIAAFEEQQAHCALLGDKDGEVSDFFVASNNAESSSIFPLTASHGFPGVKMDTKIELKMSRLDSIFSASDISLFSHWVIDVQGAELLVLRGAGKLLELCKTLEVEVSSRDVYQGGVNHQELREFLRVNGFTQLFELPPSFHGDTLFIRTT